MIGFIARQLRRLTAFIALVALLVGAPWALYRLGMPFLPDHVPSGAEIWSTLTERDTGQVFLGTLVVIGFIAWAIFAASLLADIAARIAHRPAIRLPGLHVPQAAASVLVGLVIAGTITTSAAPAAAATSGMPALPRPAAAVATASMTQDAATTHATSARIATARPGTTPPMSTWKPIHNGTDQSATRATPSKSSGPVWIVQPGDTLWAIAEQSLGDPLRYPELVELNEGRAQPDGKTLNSADFLLPGWHIHLPADATLPAEQQAGSDNGDEPDAVEVEPGDTLSQIALDTLGNANDYHQLAEINGIDNPDLIYPGEIIQIPDPAANSASVGAETNDGSQEPEDSADEPEVDDSAPPADDGNTHTGRTLTDSTDNDTGTNASDTAPHRRSDNSGTITGNGELMSSNHTAQGRHSIETSRPSAAAGTQESTDGATATASSSHERQDLWMLGGATGLLAAIAWAGLLVTRRRLEQSRKPGQRPVRSTPAEASMDRALREKAHTADPATINRAMRAMTTTVADGAPDGFDVILIGADAIELRPSTPAGPPEPFHGTDTAWTARLDDLDAAIDDDGEERLAAMPALVTLGTTSDGRIVAIDLEHHGTIALTGDEQRCRELRNHMIVELAGSPWTDGIHLTLDDVPDGIRRLDSDRIEIADDLDRAAKRLTAHAKRIREILGDTPIARARTSQLLADAWEPHILIANSADLASDECASLIETVEAGPPAAAALVVVGAAIDAAVTVEITDDGNLRLPTEIGDDIRPCAITDQELASLIGLHSQTLTDSTRATVPEASTATVDVGTDDDSTLPIEETLPTCAAVRDEAPAENLVIPDDDDESHPDSDPQLDADLAEWHSATVQRPKIAILGPAELTGPNPDPGKRRSRAVEIAVYLALHTGGVTTSKFAADLWPDDEPPSATSRRAAISRLRACLGTPSDSQGTFLPAGDDGYRLVDRLLDSELFARLTSRAHRRAERGDADDALTDIQVALALVRGPVLSETGGTAYSWLANADRMEDRILPMQIVDAAHAAVDLALGLGDPQAAQHAADVGRLVDPNSLTPLCDLIRAAQYVGDKETARNWATVAMKVHDVEVPADLPEPARDIATQALGSRRQRLADAQRKP